jgi:ferredoxin-NADP reductase
MFDFFIRALLHPIDYHTMFDKQTLVLQEIKQEADGIYSFIFKPELLCSWEAGQHGVFYFPHTKITGKTWRPFSIASAPEEGVIRIATIIKENPSDFKKHLLALEQGDTLIMNGPFGEFHTTKRIKQIVGIAGGIGITPFRALIKSIASGTITNTKITLIYSAVGNYTFKKELDQCAQHPAVEIIYTGTPEEVNEALDSQIALHKNSATYFVSGSPGMIGAVRTSLKTKGIRKIVSDPFKGY